MLSLPLDFYLRGELVYRVPSTERLWRSGSAGEQWSWSWTLAQRHIGRNQQPSNRQPDRKSSPSHPIMLFIFSHDVSIYFKNLLELCHFYSTSRMMCLIFIFPMPCHMIFFYKYSFNKLTKVKRKLLCLETFQRCLLFSSPLFIDIER